MHSPGEVTFNTPLVMLQPAVPALATANEYAPVPEPPDAASVRPVKNTPLVVDSNTVAWFAWVIEKSTETKVMS